MPGGFQNQEKINSNFKNWFGVLGTNNIGTGAKYYFNENYDKTISLLSTTNLTQHPYAALWLGLAYLGQEDHINARVNFQKAINGGAEVPQEIIDYLNSN